MNRRKQCLHYNYRSMILLEKHYTKTIICILSPHWLPSTSYIQSKSCPSWAIALAQLFYVHSFILSAPLQEMYWISLKSYVFLLYVCGCFCLQACSCTMCMWYPQRLEDGIKSSGTGVTHSLLELIMVFCKSNKYS